MAKMDFERVFKNNKIISDNVSEKKRIKKYLDFITFLINL